MEINNMEVVTGIGLDQDKDKLITTIEVLNANQDPPTIVTYHTSGKNISNNLNYLSNQLEKPLYLGHLTHLTIGENLAQNGILPLLKHFINQPGLHQNFPLLIAINNEAKDILTEDTSDDNNIDTNMQQVMLSTKKLDYMFDANLEVIINDIKTKGIEATVPTVKLTNNLNTDATDLVKEQTAVFKNDKLVGFLSKNATLGLKLIKNQTENLHLPIKCNNTITNLEVKRSSIRVNKNDIYHLRLNVTGLLKDQHCSKKELDRNLLYYLNQTIGESQRLNSDIIGIGKRTNTTLNYQNIVIKPNTNIKIIKPRSGLLGGLL